MVEAVRDLYNHDRYFPVRGKMKVLGKLLKDLAEETAVYETRAGYIKTWRFYISCKNSPDSCVNQNIEKTIIRFVMAAEGVRKYGFPEGGFGFFWIASIATVHHLISGLEWSQPLGPVMGIGCKSMTIIPQAQS
ncbi:hypothetical protein SLS57_009544 [Botryosphaeria dothidea]